MEPNDQNTEEHIGLKTQKYEIPGLPSQKPAWSQPQFDPIHGPDYIKNKRGIGICIISRGQVPIKWMMHMQRLMKLNPGGLSWKYIVVERLSWAVARSECVRKCRANNFKYLLFIDDDVFLPDDAITRMLKADKEIVTGIYWTKTENTSPVIFKEMGAGPMYNFPVDQLIEVGGSGAGCLLIDMDIFDKFDEAGLPYFVENWIHTAPDGNRVRCPIGEDHYFFIKAKELGYKAWCDTGILCDHYDYKTDKMYPGEKVVREMISQKLEQEGRHDVVKAVEDSNQDPNKKTIIFYNQATFSGDELERRGVGGAETCVILLAQEFYKLGYNVRVYSDCLRPGRYNGVWYKHYNTFTNNVKNLKYGCDLLIVSRTHKFVTDLDKSNIKQTVLWAHDMAEDPIWEDFNVTASLYDNVIVLSEFHKRELLMRFPGIEDKTKFGIIGNGVNTDLFKDGIQKVKKVSGRCIYSSTPFRGLDILLEMWPKIREKVPHAELYIFSSIKVYGEQYDDSPWDYLYVTAKQMPGVKYHGSIPQARLAMEQQKSELMLYPNTFKETYCITAAESQVAHTPVITTSLGALPETVKPGCGILIDADPNSEEYKHKFIESAIDLLTNVDKLDDLRNNCLKQDFSWTTRSKEWQTLFSFGNELVGCGGEVNPTNSSHSTEPGLYIDPSLEDIKEAVKTIEIAEKLKLEDAIIGDSDPDRDAYFRELVDNEEKENTLFYDLFKQFVSQDYRVLVFNCGLGNLPRYLKKEFPKLEIWATEESLFALDYCRQSNKQILFANHPIANPNFESNYFKVIFVENFDIIDDKKGFMEQIERVRDKGAVMVCSIPITYWNPDEVKEYFKDSIVRFYNSVGTTIVFSVRWLIK